MNIFANKTAAPDAEEISDFSSASAIFLYAASRALRSLQLYIYTAQRAYASFVLLLKCCRLKKSCLKSTENDTMNQLL